jgi:hypothetical protein
MGVPPFVLSLSKDERMALPHCAYWLASEASMPAWAQFSLAMS